MELTISSVLRLVCQSIEVMFTVCLKAVMTMILIPEVIFELLKELQYAQKYRKDEDGSGNGVSDTEEYRPPSILKKPGNLRECEYCN